MVDSWNNVIERLDQHFGSSRDFLHTISGKPLKGFEQVERRETRTVFIDGGNALLFLAPSAAVQLVRVAALEYTGSTRVNTYVEEALCVVTREEDMFDINWLGQPWTRFALPIHKDMTIETAADIARRVAERSYANKFSSLVVFDGDLTCKHVVEEEARATLRMPYCGLAKTTTVLTDQGQSAAAILHSAGPRTPWLYCLNDSKGMVKLHTLATTSYKLEVSGLSLIEAASALMATNDPSFPGYPYGLVEADTLARVTVREQRALAELLRSRLGGRWKEHTAALDAHSVLDAIAGIVS